MIFEQRLALAIERHPRHAPAAARHHAVDRDRKHLPHAGQAREQRGEISEARILRQRRHAVAVRSEEHKSELQSLMRISSAVFCLKKKKTCNRHMKPSTQTMK